MKLYDIPNNSPMKLPTKNGLEDFIFQSIDGMYSLIRDDKGRTVHISASTEVKKVDDHYELYNPNKT